MLSSAIASSRRFLLGIFCVIVLITIATSLPVGKSGLEKAAEDPDAPQNTKVTTGAVGFYHGFIAAFAVMIVSEIGDKTFFIAAIMAMRHNRFTIFSGAISALAVMTVLSTYVGQIATFIPRIYTHYISTLLFFVFGVRMLYDSQGMADDEGAEELEEVAQELKKTDETVHTRRTFISPVFVQAFTMTFLAEWGDRSQIATIILGGSENALGVCVGGVLGHSICTCMAVLGGRMIAERISVKTVTIIGGITFLFFAFTNLFIDELSWE
eukprot:m.67287 g.67287  ORF g.67287 m.67287 type:complete len:268 (-) comp15970_c0_seq4:298-1101(-)